jgi:16S rRNA (guanine527-N7)-methyltransferase
VGVLEPPAVRPVAVALAQAVARGLFHVKPAARRVSRETAAPARGGRTSAPPADAREPKTRLGVSRETRTRLEALAAEYGLGGVSDRLARLLELVAAEPSAITTVRDPAVAVDVHVADSLDGLRVEAVRDGRVLADLGSGGGFPGLVLALARPTARVALVESVARKASFLRATATELGLGNVEVVQARAESWPAGIGRQDVVTARALAALPVLVEYAAPLLVEGGHLVAWKGRRDPAEEADGQAAAEALGLELAEVVRVPPRPGADERHLHVLRKVGPTPAGYPRREGRARKRPLGVQRRS